MALLAVESARLATPSARGLRSSGQRIVVGAVGAVTLAHLTIPGRPATVCPLRALTGVPCPICGGTTAAVRVGHADLLGAMRANPFVVVGALVVACLPAVAALRNTRVFGTARRLSSRTLVAIAALGVVGSEVWQLFRFSII